MDPTTAAVVTYMLVSNAMNSNHGEDVGYGNSTARDAMSAIGLMLLCALAFTWLLRKAMR